jgi:hypothetical protein
MTQKERILDMLRIAGTTGITPWDALFPVDEGGAGCMRLAARIADLRADGWDIETRTAGGFARYVLYEPARGQLTFGVTS